MRENETFWFSKIETCRTCEGAGRKVPYVGSGQEIGPDPPPPTEDEKCPDCKGTGRWMVMVYRKPFGSR